MGHGRSRTSEAKLSNKSRGRKSSHTKFEQHSSKHRLVSALPNLLHMSKLMSSAMTQEYDENDEKSKKK